MSAADDNDAREKTRDSEVLPLLLADDEDDAADESLRARLLLHVDDGVEDDDVDRDPFADDDNNGDRTLGDDAARCFGGFAAICEQKHGHTEN